MFVLSAFVILIDLIVTLIERRFWCGGRGGGEGLTPRREGALLRARALLYCAADNRHGGYHEVVFVNSWRRCWPAQDVRFALAQSKVTIAIGGGACLCYLPTVLAKQLGEYEKAG